MDNYIHLNVLPLENIDRFSTPGEGQASLDAPALQVVTDFHFARPFVLEADVPVQEAVHLMAWEHVNMKLVVNHDEHFLGLITKEILHDRQVLMAATATGKPASEVTVRDVMIPRHALSALSHAQLGNSRVGDILRTLRDLGQEHILVLDEEEGRISGVVSARDLARFLHVPVNIDRRASSFAEIVKKLLHA